ncbi:ABC transporter permease [Streptomyces noursei]|uniref:ABC transporter permease n=1 Tax=Streptomyces noursei TaxID=1971 RepID=UPI003804A389
MLVSSHQLAEVQQLATHAVVLNHGRLIATGPMDELLGDAGTHLLQADDTARAAAGLFGASPYSALNHAMASMAFIEPLLLPITVALPAAAIASSDREWGTLRYPYVAPVSRTRLLAAKLGALTVIATLCVLTAGLLVGLAVFGWHPFHVIGAPNLNGGETAARVLSATGYSLLCMLSIATIAFTLGLLLPRGVEALGAAVAFVIAASLHERSGHVCRRPCALATGPLGVTPDVPAMPNFAAMPPSGLLRPARRPQ